ncbi:MAG: FkbM family methyltransferase, partial [Alphaproteobacteria bacterium]
AAEGTATLNASRRHPTVSTLSEDWIGRVGATDGFRRVAWDRRHAVRVTTLDALIAAHGVPRFCKIDVEGFEPQVLAGLGRPLPALAFEYVPAALDAAGACIDRLAALGPYRFNIVRGEADRFAWPDWLAPAEARAGLMRAAVDDHAGDIYARLPAGM